MPVWWGSLSPAPDLVSLAEYIGALTLSQGALAGHPFKLAPYQRRFVVGAFRGRGDAALTLARGGGKTTLCAAIGAAAVDGPLAQPRAECVIVASSFGQGKIAFGHALAFLDPVIVRDGRGPRGRFRVQDSTNQASITDKVTGSGLKVIGCDPARAHGLAPSLLILDEVAQWPQHLRDRMLAALKTSRGKIPGSRSLWIGTRPESDEHPFERALRGIGVTYFQIHAARENDPPFQRRTWKRANPGLDSLPDLEEVIREEAADARRDPEALASFRALRLNQGVADVLRSVLVDVEVFRAAERPAASAPPRRGPYVLALDLGQSAAMSGAAGYWPETRRLEALACFPERPTLAERGLADGVGRLYVSMHERGELVVEGGRVSDIQGLLGECLDRWGPPAAIVADRWREAELRQALDIGAIPPCALVSRGQGFKDGGEDVREFRAALLGDHVVPVESLLLRAAMSEARVVGDPAGNWKLAKRTEGGRRAQARDDAAAAAIIAVAEGRRRARGGVKAEGARHVTIG